MIHDIWNEVIKAATDPVRAKPSCEQWAAQYRRNQLGDAL